MSRLPPTAVLAAALLAGPATAALAHPAFDPSAIPPGTAVEATLVIPHGCTSEGGAVSPTVGVAVERTDGLTIEPLELSGWSLDESRAEFTYTADGGATADAIAFPLVIEATGAVGEVRYVSVFQRCEEGAYRWIGTPYDDADSPAAVIEIADELGETEYGAASGAADPSDGAGTTDAEVQVAAQTADDSATIDGGGGTEEVAVDDGDGEVVGDEGDEVEAGFEGGLGWGVVVLTAVVVLAGIFGARALRQRDDEEA